MKSIIKFIKELIVTIISIAITATFGIGIIELSRPSVNSKHLQDFAELSIEEQLQSLRVGTVFLMLNPIVRDMRTHNDAKGYFPDSLLDFVQFERSFWNNHHSFNPSEIHDGPLLIESTHILPDGVIFLKLTDEFGSANARMALVSDITSIDSNNFLCFVNFEQKYKNTVSGFTCEIDSQRIAAYERALHTLN